MPLHFNIIEGLTYEILDWSLMEDIELGIGIPVISTWVFVCLFVGERIWNPNYIYISV